MRALLSIRPFFFFLSFFFFTRLGFFRSFDYYLFARFFRYLSLLNLSFKSLSLSLSLYFPRSVCMCVISVFSFLFVSFLFFLSTAYTSNRILYLSSTYFVHIVIPIANRCSFSFSLGRGRAGKRADECVHSLTYTSPIILYDFLFYVSTSSLSLSLFLFSHKKIIISLYFFFNFKLRNSIGFRNTELKCD